MANPYTSVSISGYNASPPSDDGTVADSNKVEWAKHKTKLADPVKTLAESMDTNVLAAFVKRFGNTVTALAADHTLVAGNEGVVLSFTGTRTLTLLAAATATTGFSIIVHNAGTGTITIDGASAETIDGSPTLVLTDQFTTAILTCDGSNWSTIAKPQTTLPTSHIGGLVMSNGTDADHDIDTAVGSCRDDADGENLILSSILVKQIDAAWAVGSAAGGLDTGAVAEALYAVWMIKDVTNNIVDALFSLSFTSPTMPSGYTVKRFIGYVKTDSSANILPFGQSGDLFWMVDSIQDVNDSTITNVTFEEATISAPPNSLAYLAVKLSNTSTSATGGTVYIRATDSSAGVGDGNAVAWIQTAGTFDLVAGRCTHKLDSASKLDYAATESDGTATVTINTLGCLLLTRSEP